MTLLPRTMAGRAALVVLIGVLASQIAGLFLYAGDRRSLWSSARGQYAAERIAGTVRQIEAFPEAERSQAALMMGGAGLRIALSDKSLVGADASGSWRTEWFRSMVLARLGEEAPPSLHVGYAERLSDAWNLPAPMPRGMGGPGMMRRHREHMAMMQQTGPFGEAATAGVPLLVVSLEMTDGGWINFAAPALPLEPFWASGWFLSILLTTVAVVGLAAWAASRATAPLAMLSGAAERLGVDVQAPPVPEDGPREVVQAAKAFNRMQARLRGFVEDRTRMLAAVSHDLRTPITRLRLRAEFMEDEEQREKMLADLEEMEAMIKATLSFARDEAAEEPRTALDLAALLESLVSDASDMGRPAHYEGPDHFRFAGRPSALKRAFANLIDNACKYGGSASIRLETGEGCAVISIDDDGPGLPEAERTRVFEPFYRVEGSRSRETGGTGLGLSVVRAAIRAHGGEIELENRPEGGLRARIVLPITA